MRSIYLCCWLLLALAACGSAPSPTPAMPPVATASPLPGASPIPSVGVVPVLMVGHVTGATAKELTNITTGFFYANTVLASSCFKDKVMEAAFAEVGNETNEAIWKLMVSRSPLRLNVDFYMGSWWDNHITHTVGYENSSDPFTIHMNRYFVNSAYLVGNNAMHEGMGHSLGFTHYVNATKSLSEPYQMNRFYEACCVSCF